jgi:hypothetical protein
LFSLDDFWKVFRYQERFRYYKQLYQCSVDDTDCIAKARQAASKAVPELDSTVKSLADSDTSKTISLFQNTIDQLCFSTEDYSRIRNFLIDWYSSLKTNVTLGRNSHDPFALPADYLNELIKSFGYPYPADVYSVNTRASFFLDLVNLYKIKGTPLALRKALDYISLRNVDLAEYWLQKNEKGKLVFRGVSVFPTIINLPFADVRFETASDDPHWFQTEQDIIQLFNRNILALPSKTPYFGLRPYFSLAEIQKTISILARLVADQYELWKTTGTLSQDIKSDLLGITISLLECYLACIYIVVSCIPYGEPALYSADSYLCYDGTSVVISDIISQYETLTSYPAWNADDPEGDIANRQIIANQFNDLFYRQNSQNFIKTKSDIDSAGNLLNNINPSLKATIDAYISAGKWFDLLLALMLDLSAWIRVYINTEATDIISIVLGVEAIPSVTRIVNFFKPYRARLLTTQSLYIIDNPLFDFIRLHDKLDPLIVVDKIYDFITADSLTCCSGDLISCSDSTSLIEPILYSREFYDCGSYHDIGAVWDERLEIIELITVRSTWNCHTNTPCYIDVDGTAVVDGWYWYDATSACDFWGNWMDVPIEDRENWMQFLDTTATNDVEMIVTGGFRDFDTCGIFDCLAGDDLVKVRLMPPIDVDFYGNPLSGYSPFSVQFHDLSIGLVRNWHWEFGDDSTSSEESPIHIFTTPRSGGPIAAWSSANLGSRVVSFTNESDGWDTPTPRTYLWDFGDGTTSTDENPVHPFPIDTAYLIRLTVVNAYGNSTAENSILVEI